MMTSEKTGFSLAEILVGLGIMVIVIFPTLYVITNETKAVTGTREHTTAAYIGQRILEEARTFNFEKLDGAADAFKETNLNKEFKSNEIVYKVTAMEVKPIKCSDPAGKIAAKMLTFTLEYKNRENRTLKLELTTIIARHS